MFIKLVWDSIFWSVVIGAGILIRGFLNIAILHLGKSFFDFSHAGRILIDLGLIRKRDLARNIPQLLADIVQYAQMNPASLALK